MVCCVFTFYCLEWRRFEWRLPSLRRWNSHNDEATAALRSTTQKGHRCWRQRTRCAQQLLAFLSMLFLIHFNIMFVFFQLMRYKLPCTCVSSFLAGYLCHCFGGLDLAFKTPTRSIMRHEHILSEIDPVTPRNATARSIYSPIVRFLTPSKESKSSYSHCNSVFM